MLAPRGGICGINEMSRPSLRRIGDVHQRRLTQSRKEARTQRAGRGGGKDLLESITRRLELPGNLGPCVLAPLRLCVTATGFFRSNRVMSLAPASSQRAEPCRLAARSPERCSLSAFSASVSAKSAMPSDNPNSGRSAFRAARRGPGWPLVPLFPPPLLPPEQAPETAQDQRPGDQTANHLRRIQTANSRLHRLAE